MAENEDEAVLETEKVDEEADSEAGSEGKVKALVNKVKSKINLSTSMMIYIAIGLAVLILALGAYLFFTSKDEVIEPDPTIEVAEQENVIEAESSMVEESAPKEGATTDALSAISMGVGDPEAKPTEPTDSIDTEAELQALDPNITTGEPVMASILDGDGDLTTDASGASQQVPPESEDMVVELVKLQEQISALQKENRSLKNQILELEYQYSQKNPDSAPITRKAEPEPPTPKPTWGEFSPRYRGP